MQYLCRTYMLVNLRFCCMDSVYTTAFLNDLLVIY